MSACNTAPLTTSFGINGEQVVQKGLDVEKKMDSVVTELSPHRDLDNDLDDENLSIFGSKESSTSSCSVHSSWSESPSPPKPAEPAEPAPIITRRKAKTARGLFNGTRKRGQDNIAALMRKILAKKRMRQRKRMDKQYKQCIELMREAMRHEREMHKKHMEQNAAFNQRLFALINLIVQRSEDRCNSS